MSAAIIIIIITYTVPEHAIRLLSRLFSSFENDRLCTSSVRSETDLATLNKIVFRYSGTVKNDFETWFIAGKYWRDRQQQFVEIERVIVNKYQ